MIGSQFYLENLSSFAIAYPHWIATSLANMISMELLLQSVAKRNILVILLDIFVTSVMGVVLVYIYLLHFQNTLKAYVSKCGHLLITPDRKLEDQHVLVSANLRRREQVVV